jgi:predicted  nucleic acid-binding Zn-ribbon protein
MIEVKGNLSESHTGGGYCSGCGMAIEDGQQLQITYGPRGRTNSFRLCESCGDILATGIMHAEDTID